MEKVKVYKIGEAVKSRNNGNEVVGATEYAIMVNGNTALIIESDACHVIKDLPETFKIGIAKKEEGKYKLIPEAFLYPTVEWIINNVENYETTLPEWIMYYNIKNRIIENCRLLKGTMEDFGLETKNYFK